MNCFTHNFLKWAHPFMNLDTSIVAINDRMANSVYPNERARFEPSHLGLLFAKVSLLICRG